MKKLFALLAVVSLAAIGCDDKKSTGRPSNATTGGTYVKTDTVKVETHATVTDTVKVNTQGVLDTKTVRVTTTVKGEGPAVPPAGGKNDKDGK